MTISLQRLVGSLRNKPTAQHIEKDVWDNAQAHFTDMLSNRQTKMVKQLIDKYAKHVAAYFAYSPFGPDSYSVELLFADDKIARNCLDEYRKIPVDRTR